jgi:hypothetical protein
MSWTLNLLSNELVPWLTHTVTFAAMVGGIVSGLGWLREKWRQRPLIEHTLQSRFDRKKATLTVTVMNRAPRSLQPTGLRVTSGRAQLTSSVTLQPSARAEWNGEAWLKPYVLGAPYFSGSTERFVVSWSGDAEKVRLQLELRSGSGKPVGAWIPGSFSLNIALPPESAASD